MTSFKRQVFFTFKFLDKFHQLDLKMTIFYFRVRLKPLSCPSQRLYLYNVERMKIRN